MLPRVGVGFDRIGRDAEVALRRGVVALRFGLEGSGVRESACVAIALLGERRRTPDGLNVEKKDDILSAIWKNGGEWPTSVETLKLEA
jgi:hypothetical protein